MGGSCEGMTTAGRAVGWGSGPSSWHTCWCHKTALMLPPLCPSQPFKPHLEGSSGRRGCCWAAGRGQPVHDSVQLGRGGWLLAAAGAAAAAAGPAALLRVKQHPMLDRLLQGGRRGGEGRRRSCKDSRHGSMDCASRRQMGGWVVAEDEGATVRIERRLVNSHAGHIKKRCFALQAIHGTLSGQPSSSTTPGAKATRHTWVEPMGPALMGLNTRWVAGMRLLLCGPMPVLLASGVARLLGADTMGMTACCPRGGK